MRSMPCATTPLSRRKVIIATERDADGVTRVSVRDYGVGISEEARERLFEQFFTTKAKGLGMGLSIVRSIVESHGGTIAAENADGGGARFEFYSSGERQNVSCMMIPPNSLVFVIDDDPSVRKGLTRLLRSAGYQNEVFESASDFLKREQHPGPACVIVDVRMPGLNGMDLQEALIQRRREGTAHFYYRSWRHPDVRSGDEGRCGRLSCEAVSRRRFAWMC